MPVRIAVVDYLGEELDALVSALYDIEDVEPIITSDPAAISEVDGVILDGKASAFAEAITQIRLLGMEKTLKDIVVAGKPFLGIGVGLHLFYTIGMEVERGRAKQDGESVARGLNLRPGAVWTIQKRCGENVAQPHIGFAEVVKDPRWTSPLLSVLEEGDQFYYEHSFVAPTGPWIQAWTTPDRADEPFPAVVDFGGTCFGVQFHPEESGEAGMRILRRFIDIAEDTMGA